MSRTLVDSGIDWIGKIPDKWDIVKVNKIFFRRKEVNKEESPTILSLARSGVKVRDISTNEGQLAESYDNYHRVYVGDLMLNPMDLVSGANCSMSEVEGVISPAYINLAKKEDCNSKYYDYFFKNQYWVNAMFIHGKGVSFDNRWTMNSETVMDYKIPLPPLEEQTKIANYLDDKCSKIDKVIENNNKEIELLEEYKKTIITEKITSGLNNKVELKDSGISWMGKIPNHFQVIALKRLGVARNGLSYNPEDVSEDGILVLRSSNIQNNKLSLEDNVYVNKKVNDDLILKENDLLICSRNGSRSLIGKNILIDERVSGQTFGAFMCIYRSKYNKWINYVLKSHIFDYYLANFLTSTINQLTTSNLYSIKIPFTYDESEQEAIINYLDNVCSKIDKVIEYRKKIIEKLEEYKKSLIYEVVTGKKEV